MSKQIITVKAVYDIARLIGGYRQELELEAPLTVAELMVLLVNQYGEELASKLYAVDHAIWHILIFVNGRTVTREQASQKLLTDGDEVFIMTPLGGG